MICCSEVNGGKPKIKTMSEKGIKIEYIFLLFFYNRKLNSKIFLAWTPRSGRDLETNFFANNKKHENIYINYFAIIHFKSS